MSFALLFSGQGTQHPAMLPWLADDDPLVRDMRARLGVDDWRRRARESAKQAYFAELLETYDIEATESVRPLIDPAVATLRGDSK